MKKILGFCLLLLLFPLGVSWASNGQMIIEIGEATLDKKKIIFQKPYLAEKFNVFETKLIKEFHSIFANDFSFYKKSFFIIDPENEPVSDFDDKNFELWTSRQFKFITRYLFKKNIKKGAIDFKVELVDTYNKSVLISKKGHFYSRNLREKAHALTDLIFEKIENAPSIFRSKIIFVSDMMSKGSKKVKELFSVDFDGRNLKRLTYHKGIVISPSVSSDGKKVLYTLIRSGKGRKNLNLYSMNLKTRRQSIISSRKGINSGAIFTSDGSKIILTLSHTGNAEIYEVDLSSQQLRKITHHFGVDVDPDLSKDGKILTFLSNRSGKAMIYLADPSGKEKSVKRIGFVGQFNATPRFSPEGSEIVFSSWMDNSFDIFKIKKDGSQIYRLTKNFGSNEEPSFSPDGEFIAFSSLKLKKRSRKLSVQNIYIMDRDGGIKGQITRDIGYCTTPRWYNPPKT